MTSNYLVTGAAGFIGSNFVRFLFEHETDSRVTNLDALTYAGVSATIDELNAYPNHRFVRGSICDADLIDQVMPGHDIVVNFAAESHVDRSIRGPAPFLETNVVGTGVLLDAALRHGVRRFLHVSTDEVYGSLAEGFALEDSPLRPSSPYSSSKGGADLLALAYHATFGSDVVVTRCTNNFGPYQFPEKIIPLFATNLLDGEKVPLYGDGRNQRDWLHVEDHCSALHMLIHHGESGEVYNIGANSQLSNLELTRAILELFDLDESWIDWVPDRPGHDYRYAVDSSKIRALGWRPTRPLEDRLQETLEWYRSHEYWWRPLKEEPA